MTDLPLTAATGRAAASGAAGSGPVHRAPWRDGLLNVLIAGTALSVGLGLGEWLVRWVAPQQLVLKRPDVWQPVDSLGWVNRPNLNTTINTGERTVRLFTDQDGFRVGPAGRVEGTQRILLLGDSFMEALQAEYDQSLPGLLEARLAPRLHHAVAVRNTGVGGWDPPQYLIEARRTLGREPFDLVLVAVYLGNDIVPEPIERYAPRAPVEVHRLRLPRQLNGRELIDAVLYPVNDFLELRSQLFIFLKTRLHSLRTRLGLTAEEFPVGLLRQEAGSPRWSVTARILSDIRDVARTHGVPTTFVLIPAPYQVDSAEFHRSLQGFRIDSSAVDLGQPNRLLAAAMRGHHLEVLDVLPAFREAQQGGSRLYGQVDRHLSPAGHELLARLVEPLVVDRLAAPNRPAPPKVTAR